MVGTWPWKLIPRVHFYLDLKCFYNPSINTVNLVRFFFSQDQELAYFYFNYSQQNENTLYIYSKQNLNLFLTWRMLHQNNFMNFWDKIINFEALNNWIYLAWMPLGHFIVTLLGLGSKVCNFWFNAETSQIFLVFVLWIQGLRVAYFFVH